MGGVFFLGCFCNSKLTLEENDRRDHTKQQAHTQQTKRIKSKMNVFSRYTHIWFKVENLPIYDVRKKRRKGETKKNKQDAYA